MSRLKGVIIYSVAQARVRVVYLPEDADPDDWDQDHVPAIAGVVKPGEASLVADAAEIRQLGWDVVLERHLGKPASPDRCLLVKDGAVVGVIHADPNIDSVPLHALTLEATSPAIQ